MADMLGAFQEAAVPGWLGRAQEGTQQLGPTSQLQLLSISFTCPAQRRHLPLQSSMGKICLILDFLHIEWDLHFRLTMCQLLLQQILPEVSQMAS